MQMDNKTKRTGIVPSTARRLLEHQTQFWPILMPGCGPEEAGWTEPSVTFSAKPDTSKTRP
jgi:hypothetical protein